MKKKLITLCLMAFSFVAFSQPCTPNGATGNPGVTPPPDSIPCIQRGVAYDFTMQTENFTTFNGTVSGFPFSATINWTRIDSITNFPCGIGWVASKDSFGPGETGCIYVSGTTTDPVGQYPLRIYMTMNFSALGQTVEQGGEVSSLIAQAQNLGVTVPVDLSYISRVIETGNACPPRDLNASMQACSGAVGIFSLNQADNLSMKLYPNPSNGNFEIEFASEKPGEKCLLNVFDVQGRTVYSQNIFIQNNSETLSLNLDHLNKGIYSVSLTSTNGNLNDRLVIY